MNKLCNVLCKRLFQKTKNHITINFNIWKNASGNQSDLVITVIPAFQEKAKQDDEKTGQLKDKIRGEKTVQKHKIFKRQGDKIR